MKYFKHVDGLRAVAVIIVIMNHLDISYFSGGFVGVDVFFVISGFLITKIIKKELEEKNSFNYINFVYKRAKRIFPALYLVLALSFLFAVILLPPASFKVFSGTFLTSIFSVSNIFLSNNAGYFDIFAKNNPLLHTWSLAVEEQFYIFWPLLLLIAHKVAKNNIGIIVFVLFIAMGSFFINFSGNGVDIYYLVQYRAFELCFGALLAYSIGYVKLNKFSNEVVCIFGYFLIFLSVIFLDENSVFPSYNALYPVAGAMCLIIAAESSVSGVLLRNNISVFFGRISYSLYLFHWPIIAFLKQFNENVGREYSLNNTQMFLAIFISILCAWFSQRFVEMPFRSKILKKNSEKRKYLTKWVFVSSLLLAVSGHAYFSNFWDWRVLENNEKFDAANFHKDNWGGAGFKGGSIYTGTNDVSIFMLGDSHSGMLNEGVVEVLAKNNNLSVFTAAGGGGGDYASSFLLPGTTKISADQKLYDWSAIESNRAIFEEINKSKSNNKLLIYSASWAQQIRSAADFPSYEKWSSTSNEFDYLISALNRFLVVYSDAKILIMGGFPRSKSYVVSKCMQKLKLFEQESCRRMESKSDYTDAVKINSILKENFSNKKNIYFIDPYDYLCDENLCRNVDDNLFPLYSDGSHLSKEGSIYFFKLIEEDILKILNEN